MVAKAKPKKLVAGLPNWMVWGALLALLSMVGLSVWTATVWTRAPQPGAGLIEVTIPRGASIGQAADALQAAGVIESADAFEIAARLIGDDRPIQFGTYAFKEGEGWAKILDRMQRGEVVIVKVLIPEGMPSIMVAERLQAMKRLQGPIEVPAEGTVLPATWDTKPGEQRAAVLKRMQAGMVDTLDKLWPTKTARSAVKTKDEAVILASIVQKETADASEYRRIAGVYTNRLTQGMKLDADPTVIYPTTKGKPLGRRIRRSELRADNGYNTYVRKGLPQGPIANPGREAIAAVLDPEAHDFLYFVADGTGGHVFAETYPQHQANVEKWFAIRRSRGEM